MTIRTKLLIFIPLLVLLVNSVTFFLFQSSKLVQQSYNVMMDRILLYQQATKSVEENLKQLSSYLLDPVEQNLVLLAQTRAKIKEQRNWLQNESSSSSQSEALLSYVNMLDTYLKQEGLASAKWEEDASRALLAYYDEAEKTAGFIREEGQQLVDLELSFYQPIYKQIQVENIRMNKLGISVFIINTLMSILLAVWISRSITGPVGRLVHRAKQISKGQLEVEPRPLHSNDELGLLSGALEQMSSDLVVLIQKDKASLERDRLVKELELQALQSQINPHFLFNTLNAISKLALLEGSEKTSDLIISMSNLLRYNLRNLDQPVSLRDEVAHVKEYFLIQQARFRDRIRLELDINESVLRQPIPSLTLQPLVENAFLHGIEHMESSAIISLSIARAHEGVRISLSDNGKGMTEENRLALIKMEARSDNNKSTGLGTKNVFKRLRLFYEMEMEDLVTIESTLGEGTTVTLQIPLREAGA